MTSKLLPLALPLLLGACLDSGDDPPLDPVCEPGAAVTHACVGFADDQCRDETAQCDGAGQWQCPEGYAYTGEPCPAVAPERDCSELGGGQAVVGQRCLDGAVEYCIYSDTTQTATWSVIEQCAAPLTCSEVDDAACCQSPEDVGAACASQ